MVAGFWSCHSSMAGRRGPTRPEEMIMTQDKARKIATRQRMAETGEPYSVARHAVESEYSEAAVDSAPGDGAPGDGAPGDGAAGNGDAGGGAGGAGLSARERADQARLLADQAQERAELAQERAGQ